MFSMLPFSEDINVMRCACATSITWPLFQRIFHRRTFAETVQNTLCEHFSTETLRLYRYQHSKMFGFLHPPLNRSAFASSFLIKRIHSHNINKSSKIKRFRCFFASFVVCWLSSQAKTSNFSVGLRKSCARLSNQHFSLNFSEQLVQKQCGNFFINQTSGLCCWLNIQFCGLTTHKRQVAARKLPSLFLTLLPFCTSQANTRFWCAVSKFTIN